MSKKKGKSKKSVQTIEPSAVPNPALHKQSKKKHGSRKRTAAKG